MHVQELNKTLTWLLNKIKIYYFIWSENEFGEFSYGYIGFHTIIERAGLDPCGSLPTQNILWFHGAKRSPFSNSLFHMPTWTFFCTCTHTLRV